MLFQSTPSAWRETLGREIKTIPEKFQSTPSAWRETLLDRRVVCDRIFQSTPSAWRETCVSDYMTTATAISIHSLRMEGDRRTDHIYNHILTISIHSLRMEGDPVIHDKFFTDAAFQSTPSAWRETSPIWSGDRKVSISIHSLRMEGDHSRDRLL